jgi:hypothetical protein
MNFLLKNKFFDSYFITFIISLPALGALKIINLLGFFLVGPTTLFGNAII